MVKAHRVPPPSGEALLWRTSSVLWLVQLFVVVGLVRGQDVPLGSFSNHSDHAVSGMVFAIDSRRLRINNFNYDGVGPEAFFWAGTGDRVSEVGIKLMEIPTCASHGLSRYTNTDIIIELPPGKSVADISWLSVWSTRFSADFGSLIFADVSADLAQLSSPTSLQCSNLAMTNCVTLQRGERALQLSWNLDTPTVYFELAGVLGEGHYMSFGVSGSNETMAMVGGDVAVVIMDGDKALAFDYNLLGKMGCVRGQGVCPDDQKDLTSIEGSVVNGITRIAYKRLLNTGDETDSILQVDSTQQFIWAVGATIEKFPFGLRPQHHDYRGGIKLNLGSAVSDCEGITLPDDPCRDFDAEEPWYRPPVTATTLDLNIGPCGGPRGYRAITSKACLGMAWYVNGLLLPVLGVSRGATYTFRVNGGDDRGRPAEYHPLYITTDAGGGFGSQIPSKQESLRGSTLAGFDASTKMGTLGPGCPFEETNDSESAHAASSFEEYKQTLTAPNCTNPGEFTWTPDAATPDVVYYQSFAHPGLGWKIYVFDDVTDPAAMALLESAATESTECPDENHGHNHDHNDHGRSHGGSDENHAAHRFAVHSRVLLACLVVAFTVNFVL